MRLWTVHPKYLDAKGLVALWREGLLAQKVLRGDTRGYRNHPQLIRFKTQSMPAAALACYLRVVHEEAIRRGYHFDATKIASCKRSARILETKGQLLYEWKHLKRKLRKRAPKWRAEFRRMATPAPHPLFRIVEGARQEWEVVDSKRKPKP